MLAIWGESGNTNLPKMDYIFRYHLSVVSISLSLLVVLLFFIDWIVSSQTFTFQLFNTFQAIDFQTNYERKRESACHVSFQNEERDVETMQDINKILIENILPSSVAAKFLSPDRAVNVSLFH